MNFEKFEKAAHAVIRSSKNNDNYIFVYPELIKYFSQLKEIDKHSFIIGTHVVYGWMPTILTLHQEERRGIDQAITILNKVKQGKDITEDELLQLKKIINNSIVGPSKLLHFISPHNYAIWDSRVCNFVYKDSYADRIKRFFDYTKIVKEIAAEERFKQVYPAICNKMGYEVSPLRAIEWIMWNKGKKQG